MSNEEAIEELKKMRCVDGSLMCELYRGKPCEDKCDEYRAIAMAIEALEHQRAISEWCGDGETYYVVKKGSAWSVKGIDIEQAWEKQIPKKPTTDGCTVSRYCPNCKKQLRTYVNVEDTRFLDGTYTRKSLHPAYCEKCGQAIDWAERKEE